MVPSKSYIPPVSPQAPINVHTASLPVSDPAGLAGTTVAHTQQIQHPATPMCGTDIIPHAVPQQTQPVMIPQQTIVPQQQMGMNPQTSTLQQQQQQQIEAQAPLLEQQLGGIQLPSEAHQHSLLTSAVQKHQQEFPQQICAQQPVQQGHPASQQHMVTKQTGMEKQAISVPQTGEQPQTYKQQLAGDSCDQTIVQSQQLQQQFQQQQTLLQQQQQQQLEQQALLFEQHQLYVQQQLDQQQQKSLLQQQHQLQQHQALQHKQLMDQQQIQALMQQTQGQQQQSQIQQEQPQQALLQYQLDQQQRQHPNLQQEQNQLFQQIGQHEGGTQIEPEMQQQSEQQLQKTVLQQQIHQTQQQNEQLQQQILIRKVDQQQQQAQIQKHLQQQLILQPQQQQQKTQLQQHEHQKVQLKQQLEQQALLQQQLEQQQVLLQQQQAEILHQHGLMKQLFQEQHQQAPITQPQQTEKQEPVPISQSSIQQQPTDMQQLCMPQLKTNQFTHHPAQQQIIDHQQHVAFIQQQAFVAQPQQHHTSVMEPHLSVGAPAVIESVKHQSHAISQAHVPMPIQTSQIPIQMSPVVLTQQGEVQPQKQGQIPVQFLGQSVSQVPRVTTEAHLTNPAAMIQGQMQIIQNQQIPLQTSYPAPVTPAQSQVTAQPFIHTEPLHTTLSQSQTQHGQFSSVDIQMISQPSQAVQPLAAVASAPSQTQYETHAQQNVQMPGLIQPKLQQHTQGQPPCQEHPQPSAGILAPQFAPQLSQQIKSSLPHDMTHISPQQQVLHYQQMILSSGSDGSVGTKAEGLTSVIDSTNPNATPHPIQAGQGTVLGQTAIVQAQQQSSGTTADSSVIQQISQPFMSQSAEQYQQQLQNLSQVQQPPALSTHEVQLPVQPIPTPIQQPISLNQTLTFLEDNQIPPQCPAPSHLLFQPPAQLGPANLAEPQSQSRTLPLYNQLVTSAPPSPQHHTKQMLPAHTHTQTNIQTQTHSQTQTQVQPQTQSQTHTEMSVPEHPVLSQTMFPVQQIPLSPSHNTYPSPSLPSFPSRHPAAAPTTELPTSPPEAQVTLPGRADFIPTSPPPVTAHQSLESNAPKPPKALLQDCDLSLLGIAQVHEV